MPLFVDTQHRLAEADPAPGVRLLAHQIMALACHAHRQHIVSIPGRLAPHRRESCVQLNLLLVGQHLDPAGTVGVGPDGIIDPCKIGG